MRKAAVSACLIAALLALPSAASAQDGEPPLVSQFEKVTLNDRPGEPVSLAVLPDRRVLHTSRTGEVRLFDPKTQVNSLAADVDVYQHDEEGLQGIAIDPNFTENHWVYLYYSPNDIDTPVDDPLTPAVNEGDAPFTGTQEQFDKFKGAVRLSRFKFEKGELKLDTEQKILDVPVDRGICCHVGGQIAFDPQGNLLLSTGDDSNPFESEGYSPLDDSEGRHPAFDARRTSGNTNDLRGKLLRIRVKENGSYSIPAGNLFRPGTPKTKPEIYVMGLRNPFRFDVNSKTGDVYMADYSPDANEADPERGPAGHGRWMLIRKAANYGWPFCVTPDIPYIDYDFATQTSGEPFNCDAAVNDSRYNTGQRVLPAVTQPDVWYSYNAEDTLFPELWEDAYGDGISPMAGPAYQFAQNNPSVFKWPKYYNGQPLFYEWSRDYVKEFRLNKPNGKQLKDIRQVQIPLGYSWVDPEGDPDHPVDNPIDMEFGPDGALYVLEYGDGYFAENPDAKLTKVNFVRGNRSPIVKVAAEGQPNPNVPLELLLDEDPTVQFSSEGTEDPDEDRITYAWDFNSDGKVDSREENPSYTYTENGKFDATLKVTDRTGRTSSASVPIIVGNKTPIVTLTTSPAPGEPFQFGQAVTYTVTVEDDQEVDCNKVLVSYILGHDDHGHPLTASAGCTGTITTTLAGHDPSANLRAVFNASYTDEPVDEDVPPLTGSDEVVIPPNP
jgi:glucose/arabinose dehydrogenase